MTNYETALLFKALSKILDDQDKIVMYMRGYTFGSNSNLSSECYKVYYKYCKLDQEAKMCERI